MPPVDVGRVAKALNLTEQRVQQLTKEGMPKEARGRYDAVKCMQWYIRYLQDALEKKAVPMEDGKFVGVRAERVRLLRADADLREMELAKERSQLVSIANVEKEMTNLVLVTKARVLAVAARVSPELIGETSRLMIQAKLEKALKDALIQLEKSGSNGKKTGADG